nr:MAG TPA: hypothetical protein [Caudoviricetes sp.]
MSITGRTKKHMRLWANTKHPAFTSKKKRIRRFDR